MVSAQSMRPMRLAQLQSCERLYTCIYAWLFWRVLVNIADGLATVFQILRIPSLEVCTELVPYQGAFHSAVVHVLTLSH